MGAEVDRLAAATTRAADVLRCSACVIAGRSGSAGTTTPAQNLGAASGVAAASPSWAAPLHVQLPGSAERCAAHAARHYFVAVAEPAQIRSDVLHTPGWRCEPRLHSLGQQGRGPVDLPHLARLSKSRPADLADFSSASKLLRRGGRVNCRLHVRTNGTKG